MFRQVTPRHEIPPFVGVHCLFNPAPQRISSQSLCSCKKQTKITHSSIFGLMVLLSAVWGPCVADVLYSSPVICIFVHEWRFLYLADSHTKQAFLCFFRFSYVKSRRSVRVWSLCSSEMYVANKNKRNVSGKTQLGTFSVLNCVDSNVGFLCNTFVSLSFSVI